MSKRKRTTAKRPNKQTVSKSSKKNQVSKPSTSSRIIRFLVNQLISIVLKAIFEQQIKDLSALIWELIKVIFG